MTRWFLFFLAILAGAAGVLFYTWQVNPTQKQESSPDELRVDFKTDFVLMVAEVYAKEKDLEGALLQLTFLGDQPAHDIINPAISFAEQQGYKKEDLVLMWTLRDSLR